jgi:maltooligosyltrehalose synthase
MHQKGPRPAKTVTDAASFFVQNQGMAFRTLYIAAQHQSTTEAPIAQKALGLMTAPNPGPNGEHTMKTPKLLPWYARKAGVTLERAEALWRKAVREATAQTGWVGNADYWSATMNNFVRLLDEERSTLCAPRVLPYVRSQNRMMRLPLQAMEDLFSALNANWQRHMRANHRSTHRAA